MTSKDSRDAQALQALADEIADHLQEFVPSRLSVGSDAIVGNLAPLLLGGGLVGGLIGLASGSPQVIFIAVVAAVIGLGMVMSGAGRGASLPNIPSVHVRLLNLGFVHRRVDRKVAVWHSVQRLWPIQAVRRHKAGDLRRAEELARELRAECEALPAFLDSRERESHGFRNETLREALGDEQPLFDVEARVLRSLRAVRDALERFDVTEVALSPMPRSMHPHIEALAETGIEPAGRRSTKSFTPPVDETGEPAVPSEGGNADSAKLREDIRTVLDTLSEARTAACDTLASHTRLVLASPHDASLAMLCPSCNAGFISAVATQRFVYGKERQIPRLNAAAQLLWRPSQRKWECAACAAKTMEPFPVPRVLAETLAPAFELLIEEHFEARQNVYADIDNQKRHYRNEAEKELFQRRDSHRRDSRPLLSRLAEINAQAEAVKAKVAAFGALLIEFEVLERERLQELNRESQEITADIQRSQAAFEQRFKAKNEEILTSALASMDRSAELARIETAAQFSLMQRIATASERTANASERTAAVQMAWARQSGMLKPPAWNLIGRGQYLLTDVQHAISGKSDVGNYLPSGDAK